VERDDALDRPWCRDPFRPLWHSRPSQKSKGPDELIVGVVLPKLAGAGSCYVRLEYRRQMEIAVVGATAVVSLEGGVVCDGRIAITALAPTVRRVAVAEAALVGTDGGPVTAEDAGRLAAEAATPISDASVRRNVGRSILLGLEILIIADIVKTITSIRRSRAP